MFEYYSFVFCCISSVAIYAYWNTFIAGVSFSIKKSHSINPFFYKGSGKILQDFKCAAMLAPPVSINVPLSFNRASSFTLVFFNLWRYFSQADEMRELVDCNTGKQKNNLTTASV